jgi:hypothetical protein
MKRLACENKGIFYQVADNAALGEVMSSYYAYYAASISNTGVRWILYNDAITGTEMLSSCTPLYDTTDPTVEISVTVGVACMDLNVIRSVADLRTDTGWDSLYDRAGAAAETCVASWSGRSEEDIDNSLEYIRSLESINGAQTCSAGNDNDEDDDSISGVWIVLITTVVIVFLCCFTAHVYRNHHHQQQQQHHGGGEIMMGSVTGVVQPKPVVQVPVSVVDVTVENSHLPTSKPEVTAEFKFRRKGSNG